MCGCLCRPNGMNCTGMRRGSSLLHHLTNGQKCSREINQLYVAAGRFCSEGFLFETWQRSVMASCHHRAGSHKATSQLSSCSLSPCWSHRTLPIHVSALAYLCYTTTCSWLTLTVCNGAVRRDGINTICVVRYLRLAQRCCWRSKYFGEWHCVLGCVISDVSRTVLASFIFKTPAVQEERDCSSPADEGTTRAHGHGAASQSTWIRAMLVLLSVALQFSVLRLDFTLYRLFFHLQ